MGSVAIFCAYVKTATHRRCGKVLTNIPAEMDNSSSSKEAISEYWNSDFQFSGSAISSHKNIHQILKVPKIQQKTRVLCASFLRCLDRFWLLNINTRHQPVELPPCKIPDLRFIPGPPVRSLGGQSFVDHNDPVRFF